MTNPDKRPLAESAELLRDGATRGARFLETILERPVAPRDVAQLDALDVPFPEGPTEPAAVLRELDELGSSATVATVGPRYFGFVIGGVLPASAGAAALAAAWDQCAGLRAVSPIAAKLEDVAARWLKDALGLDEGFAVGFVTGGTMANVSCLAAARRALSLRAGWDVDEQGLEGAPPLRVVVGDELHVSVLEALGLLGLGRARVERVPADEQGRMRASELPELDERTILCLQAGNVNTGAFDPAEELVARAHEREAWVHVDGAFGLWALASPTRAALARGCRGADSLALDAHKWLNVPYDSGLAFVRHPEMLRGALSVRAPYLLSGDVPDPTDHTPEMSRRGRGIEVWAALRSLGRTGLADLVDRCCEHAQAFATGFEREGARVLNEVVLNQVLVGFGSDAETDAVIAGLQREGTCWAGGTTWLGRRALRVAVSNWSTREQDVEASLRAIMKVARGG